MACGLHSCYGTHIVHIHTHNPTGVLFTHTSRPGHVSRLDWHLQCRQGSNNREFRTTDAARARLYKILRPHLSGGWNSFFKQNITDIVFLLRTTSEHQSELPHPRSSFTDCQIHSAGSTRTKDCRTQRRRRRQATEQHINNSATPTLDNGRIRPPIAALVADSAPNPTAGAAVAPSATAQTEQPRCRAALSTIDPDGATRPAAREHRATRPEKPPRSGARPRTNSQLSTAAKAPRAPRPPNRAGTERTVRHRFVHLLPNVR